MRALSFAALVLGLAGFVAAQDPISITASSFKNRPVYRGGAYTLKVVLSLPAASGRLLGEEEEEEVHRELRNNQHNKTDKYQPKAPKAPRPTKAPKPPRSQKNYTMKNAVSSTNYKLLVTVPAGGSMNVTYKSTNVNPGLKPKGLNEPQLQSFNNLLWDPVTMYTLRNRAYSRTFRVIFKIAQTASSPLVFGASVLKGNTTVKVATPVTVTVANKN